MRLVKPPQAVVMGEASGMYMKILQEIASGLNRIRHVGSMTR